MRRPAIAIERNVLGFYEKLAATWHRVSRVDAQIDKCGLELRSIDLMRRPFEERFMGMSFGNGVAFAELRAGSTTGHYESSRILNGKLSPTPNSVVIANQRCPSLIEQWDKTATIVTAPPFPTSDHPTTGAVLRRTFDVPTQGRHFAPSTKHRPRAGRFDACCRLPGRGTVNEGEACGFGTDAACVNATAGDRGPDAGARRRPLAGWHSRECPR